MNGKRGRPKGRPTVKVHALLYPEQKAKLDFLASRLTGSPPLVGLLRDAVDEFLERHFTGDLAGEYDRMSKTGISDSGSHEPLRLVR